MYVCMCMCVCVCVCVCLITSNAIFKCYIQMLYSNVIFKLNTFTIIIYNNTNYIIVTIIIEINKCESTFLPKGVIKNKILKNKCERTFWQKGVIKNNNE